MAATLLWMVWLQRMTAAAYNWGPLFGPHKSHNTKEKAEVAPVLGPRSGPQKGATCCGEKKPPGLQK